MEKKIKILTIAVIALSVVSIFTLISLIYGAKRMPPGEFIERRVEQRMDHPRGGMPILERRLNLDSQQEKKIRSYRHSFFSDSRQGMRKYRELRRELRHMYVNENISDEEIGKLLDSIGEVAKANEANLGEHLRDIYQTLNPEQKKKMDELIDSLEMRMMHHRPMNRFHGRHGNGNGHRGRNR